MDGGPLNHLIIRVHSTSVTFSTQTLCLITPCLFLLMDSCPYRPPNNLKFVHYITVNDQYLFHLFLAVLALYLSNRFLL